MQTDTSQTESKGDKLKAGLIGAAIGAAAGAAAIIMADEKNRKKAVKVVKDAQGKALEAVDKVKNEIDDMQEKTEKKIAEKRHDLAEGIEPKKKAM